MPVSMDFNVLWTSLLVLVKISLSGSTGDNMYCHNQVFEAECGPGNVIIINEAKYGRMKIGRCVTTDFGYVGCKTDVIDLVAGRCSGKQQCRISVPDEMFDNTRPCNDDLKSYLTTSYRCLPVTSVNHDRCEDATHLKLTSQHGYLASVVTQMSSCGSHLSPWIIETEPGRRINFTVHDFSGPAAFLQSKETESTSCMKYATIRESNEHIRHDICAGSYSTRHVYTSTSNIVEVELSTMEDFSFLIYFEVIGCSKLPRPPNTWVKMTEDGAMVGCKGSSETWHLLCQGHTWLGQIGNCSTPSSSKPDKVIGSAAFSLGTSILIVVVVAGVIGAIILLVGVVLLKRRSKHSGSTRVIHHDGSSDHYKETFALSKATIGRTVNDYPLTALPLHATIDPQSRGGTGGPGLNDYTYVWETPGHCSAMPGGGARFGTIAVDGVEDCCLATCNNPSGGGGVVTDDTGASTNNKSIHSLMTSMSPCTPTEVTSTALRKQMEVDYSVKCGTLSTHVPAYMGCTLCGEPQQCSHVECGPEVLNRT